MPHMAYLSSIARLLRLNKKRICSGYRTYFDVLRNRGSRL